MLSQGTTPMSDTRSTGAIDVPLVFSRAELQELGPMPALRQHPFQAIKWLLRTGIGIVVLVGLLAFAAAIPILNVLALGYLMKIQGRVARTGRLRSAFYLVPAAERLGILLLAVWLFLLPIQILSGLTRDSWLLSPGGAAAWWWSGVLVFASLLIATHLLLAIGCGGAWWRFVRPITNARWLVAQWRSGDYWRDANHAIREFLAAFQFLNLLRLGLIGYAAAYVWLVVPTLLFTILDDVTSRWQLIGFVVGCITLTVTLTWLPLMLAHVAAEARLGATFELATVLRLAGRTPFRWAIATAILLACSVLPMLYTALFKIRNPAARCPLGFDAGFPGDGDSDANLGWLGLSSRQAANAPQYNVTRLALADLANAERFRTLRRRRLLRLLSVLGADRRGTWTACCVAISRVAATAAVLTLRRQIAEFAGGLAPSAIMGCTMDLTISLVSLGS